MENEWNHPRFSSTVRRTCSRARRNDGKDGRETGVGRKLFLLHPISLSKSVAYPDSLHPGPLQFVLGHSPENTETREEFSLLDNGALKPLSVGSLFLNPFSCDRNGYGVISVFLPKCFYLLIEPAVLYSIVILSHPNLRNCHFSYVFITPISLWVITRHKLGPKLLPSSFLY